MVVETRQRYVLVDPTTLPMVPEFEGAPRLADLNNKRVGVIDDSKVNAKEYLEQLTDLLDERFGITSIKYHAKPSASKPADPAIVAEMAKECDYVIVGIGDWGSCSACSVHDGVHVEKAGIPSVTICTDRFIETSNSMAAMWGAAGYPVIFTPHPIAGLSDEQLRSHADEIFDTVVTILTGR